MNEQLTSVGRQLTSWGSELDSRPSTADDGREMADEMPDVPVEHLLLPQQDEANFRLAAATVLRQALQTQIGDQIDGRRLEHEWIEY